eukprot:364696-Chlamydomonas_euryale.AAC.8
MSRQELVKQMADATADITKELDRCLKGNPQEHGAGLEGKGRSSRWRASVHACMHACINRIFSVVNRHSYLGKLWLHVEIRPRLQVKAEAGVIGRDRRPIRACLCKDDPAKVSHAGKRLGPLMHTA